MLDQNNVPLRENEGDPRMVIFLRDGKEVSAVGAADGRDAIIVAARMILDQQELRIGDQLVVTRI